MKESGGFLLMADLEAGGVIVRTRDGRRNRYEVNPRIPLRHDLEAHRTVGDLMKMVEEDEPSVPL